MPTAPSNSNPTDGLAPAPSSGATAQGASVRKSTGPSSRPGDDRLEQPVLPAVKFNRQLAGLVAKSQSKQEIIQKIGSLLNGHGCRGLWLVTRNQAGEWTDPVSLYGDDTGIRELIGQSLSAAAALAIRNESLVCIDQPALPGNVLAAGSVTSGQQPSDVLMGIFPSSQPVQAGVRQPGADWIVTAAADAISKWQMSRMMQASQQQLASLSGFVSMSAAINKTANQLDASITLVNELKSASGADHVALMMRKSDRGPFRLVAMSGIEFFDRNAETTRIIESTVLGAGREPVFQLRAAESTDSSDEVHINLQNFCAKFDSAGSALLPLFDSEKKLFGWLVVGLNEKQCANSQTETHFRQISSLVAGQLETVLKSQRTSTRIWLDNSRRLLGKNLARKMIVAGLLVTLLMALPFTYKIPCDCQLQLTRRRFIAAPYEGLLEKTLVSSGDVVTGGQPLARMDASQLRMELSGLTANLESERKKRDSALARGSIAESQIARSEMTRLSSEIAIIQERLNNTEIRSPIAGVVVSGDLDNAEGAPMEMGQNLFEVGPLEQMLVEVHIPETEIKYASTGMTVAFEFAAFPFESFTGTITRIHPRAEVIDSESVFVAEVNMDNSSGQLRPGMKGRARVMGGRYPLGWNLFHSAFEKARHWLIW